MSLGKRLPGDISMKEMKHAGISSFTAIKLVMLQSTCTSCIPTPAM